MDEMSLVRKIKEQEETIINLRADITLLTEIIRDLEGKNRGLENSRNFIMNVLKQQNGIKETRIVYCLLV